MNLKAILLEQPGVSMRTGILLACIAATLSVGYFHTWAGLRYEFHVFFILPLLVVSWFCGKRYGYGLAVLAAVEWFIADLSLTSDPAYILPLTFNTVMRLAIFLFSAWLIAEMHRVLMQESRLAREDPLTRLPNRREFLERGHQAFAQAKRQGAPLTAVFIDLDRFKEVNDTLGHAVGDSLLTTVAHTIREQLRASDIPGRLGGDEFALLLPNMNVRTVTGYVDKLRDRLLAAMKANTWPVTFSIGVASYHVAPHDFHTLIGQADALMYEVKRCGRDRILQQEF